jgi:hypothetical protein
VRRNPVGFARLQWETWSPPGWFDEAEFGATAQSFTGPDWAAVTLNAYRSRWRHDEPFDARYAKLQQRLGRIETLATPTLMIQGGANGCDEPASSEGQERFFTGGYRRVATAKKAIQRASSWPELASERQPQHLHAMAIAVAQGFAAR